ncbi:MAG: FAD-dependent oxidoreductase [Candidatus Latescibacteria bacterium]|nr:FAD-dependent oxidoreductase [Candidatus Latescibacterota bacterium]
MPPEISGRLAPQVGEAIDRNHTFQFSFEGRTYPAHPGDTIASALTAAGVGVLSRSFKYHRPRGLLCGAGHCPNCLVQIGDEPNVRACQRPVEEGMAVSAQNVWPSLDTDLLSLTKYLSPLMPVGFYYKTFMRPRALWPLYEDFLRRAAGLGVVDPDSHGGGFSKQFLHTQVAVVGGGPAGLSAALAAAAQGAQVLLFEEQPALGGHLRFSGSQDSLPALLQEIAAQPRIQVFTGTMVTGWYADHWLVAVQGKRLYKIRAQAIVAATGAYEQPLIFAGNDLPGVMLGGAVLRLLRLYGVVPGQRAVVVADNDEGWEAALALREAGVELIVVVARRENERAAELEAAGVRVLSGHTVVRALGDKKVWGAVLARVDGQGRAESKTEKRVDCGLIVVSGGWAPAADLAYMAGCRGTYDETQAEFRFSEMRPGFYAAGRVNGMYRVEAQRLDGRRAGLEAAAQLGLETGPDPAMAEQLRVLRQAQSPRSFAPAVLPGKGKGKRFVCLCEDVTDVDVETAIGEGYESPELLKRYSTISMGPCQGKMCGMNTLHLCARARSMDVGQVGRTTARPPVNPMSLGALAGQHLEPVQLSPIHSWHLDHGAKMMGAGLWMRPEHYGDAVAEVQAVRRGVGLIDVSTLGKLQFTGPGAPALLERLYINQWRRLGLGRARYGVICNDEGVVLDDGVGARLGEEEWYLTTTSSGAAAVFELIQWWMQAGWGKGVHATDLTEAFAAFNLAGPQSRAVLQQLTQTDLGNEAFPYMHARHALVAGVPCRLLRLGFTGELSYEIHCPSGYGLHLWEALMAAGTPFGISPFGVEAQRVLRLEKAHIIIGQDTDALADAFSAGLEGMVKMDKPDFLGKRALMRVADTGVQQRLTGFKMAQSGTVPEEGLQIVERRQGKLEILGWITSSRFSPTLGEIIGLCWLPAALAEQNGEEFTIFREGALLEARVHHGAFYDPQGERVRQ